MNIIQEAHQFSLIVEELRKKFVGKNSGRGHSGRSGGWSYGGHNDDQSNKDKVAHYISGLRSSIQEELSLVQIMIIEEAYQFSLKVEEKLNKKYDNKNNGRGCSG